MKKDLEKRRHKVSSKIKIANIYTPNLTNAGVNPLYSTSKPSVLTLLTKQSLIDL